MKNTLVWGIIVLLLAPVALAAELTQFSVHAPSVQEGDEITLTYTLVDDNALQTVQTDVFLSGSINHQTSEYVSKNVYKHTQTFTLPQSHGEQDFIHVRIKPSNQWAILKTIPLQPKATQTPSTQTTSNTGVMVVVDPVRDIPQGESLYYKVQIINTENTEKYVTIGLSDVSDWATYRVDPYPTVLLEENEVHEAYIYLKVDEDAPAGIQYFDVTANYDNQQEAATVKLAVLQEYQQSTLEKLQPYIIAAALILLIAAIIFVIMNYNKPETDNGGDEDDFITYY